MIVDRELLNTFDKLIDKYIIIQIKIDFLKHSPSDIDLNELEYLINIAEILSCYRNTLYKTRALKVATTIPSLISYTFLLNKCNLILANLSNYTTLNLISKSKNLDDYKKFSTGLSLFQLLYREEIHKKVFLNETVLLNSFQLNAAEQIAELKNVSISAPTSVGKSYLLKKLITHNLYQAQGNCNFIYLVPTRALIRQVMVDLQSELNNVTADFDYFITCSSDISRLETNRKGIFVLTQERLYQLCNNNLSHKLNISMIIVDEAQSIAKGKRGVLLEQSIEYLKTIWKDCKIVFLSPLISNPYQLLDGFDLPKGKAIYENFSLVNQNIIKVTLKKKSLEIQYKNKLLKQLPINSNVKITKIEEKISYVYTSFNNNGNSIIYCNKPYLTRRICNILSESYADLGNPKLDKFASFLESYIHKEYELAKLIRKGITYHFSDLPPVIRQGIEELASEGLLNTIACTSTLLEGVNIPAKNIYIFNPKANNSPFSHLDFWNLIGRAGRMGFDLHGNVICIEVTKWDKEYNNINLIEDLKFAKDNILENECSNLTASILERGKNVTETYSHIENDMINRKVDGKYILKHKNLIDQSTYLHINSKIEDLIAKSLAPIELTKKLIGVNIDQINALWVYFTRQRRIKKCIPLHPLTERANSRTLTILNIINDIFLDNEYTYSQLDRLRWISLNWMRETQLKKIILYKIDDESNFDNINKLVEKTIKDVNNVVRYKLAKYLYAYEEILKCYLISINKTNLLQTMANLPLFIEFGASTKLSLDLMARGMLRTSAIEISRLSNECKIDLANLKMSDLEMADYLRDKIFEELKLINRGDINEFKS